MCIVCTYVHLGVIYLLLMCTPLLVLASESVTGGEDGVASILKSLDSLVNDNVSGECRVIETFEYSVPRNTTKAGEIHPLLEQKGKLRTYVPNYVFHHCVKCAYTYVCTYVAPIMSVYIHTVDVYCFLGTFCMNILLSFGHVGSLVHTVACDSYL